jgi:hypothetical protein
MSKTEADDHDVQRETTTTTSGGRHEHDVRRETRLQK